MDVSMIDGFITAVVSGPNPAAPSVLFGWIWDAEQGRASPTFANAEESARVHGLIMRHWNDVNDRLNRAPEQYEPLTYERKSNGKKVTIIDEWCMGYFRGILIDRTARAPLLSEHPDWFAAIMLYGTEEGWQELARRQCGDEEHQVFVDSLAETARRIHLYWIEKRREQIARGDLPGVIARSEPRRRASKLGRNDPCPCGSGKKYKRCHGADERGLPRTPPDAATQYPLAARRSTSAEPPPLRSPLCQKVGRDGTSVDVEIYEDGAGSWLLEIVDAFGNSIVWEDAFPTDRAALTEALNTIGTEGIASLVGAAPAGTTRH
jgi:uncharacterized protein